MFIDIMVVNLLLLIAMKNLGALFLSLIIISPHWDGVKKEFTMKFKEWSKAAYQKEVEVEWLDQGGTSDDLRFIKSEFVRSPEGINIDLFWGGGLDPYLDLSEKGLLQSYTPPEDVMDKIPDRLAGTPLYDPEKRWFGTVLSGFGIIYNKVLLKKFGMAEPRTWEDLANPKLEDWVGLADPRHSGSIHMIYEIILQAYGWEKGFEILTSMAGNAKSFYQQASQVPKDVALGQVALGVAIDSYAWAQQREAGPDKIGFTMPERLTVINPDCIGILKGAPHPEEAKLFVRFVLSKEGQSLWMQAAGSPGGPKQDTLGRLCIIPGLYDELKGSNIVSLNPFEWKETLSYDSKKGFKRWGLLNDLIGTLLIDCHPELKKTWKKTGGKELPAGGKTEFFKPPITEEEGLALSENWNDPLVRNRKINEWLNFAKKKYSQFTK